jgi:hypothetical protein
MITVLPTSVRNLMNNGNTNSIADFLRRLRIGDRLGFLPTVLRHVNMLAQPPSPYNIATLETLVLPDDAKAASIISAYARTATAGVGALTVAAANATPTTGQIAVAPNGNIVALAADAQTDVDIYYIPEIQDVFELGGPPANNPSGAPQGAAVVPTTGVMALPTGLVTQGIVMLMEAEVITATAATGIGKKIVTAPGATGIVAGQAQLNAAKTAIQFAIADGVTSARVKLGVVAIGLPNQGIDVQATLEAASPYAV